jgi:peptidoglycan/xylan/chitin deacetylase (PgdA/CDA1 family)
LESAHAFLRGEYIPARDLCLLTFDDGFKEHFTIVTPILAEARIAGLFFPITLALEGRVLAVHMSHFLMATIGFDAFRAAFFDRLGRLPDHLGNAQMPGGADNPYAHETAEAGSFKYLFNFVLDPATRDSIVRSMFEEHLGDESAFSRTLYVSWEEARAMQREGMIMGGHSHNHIPLSTLSPSALTSDLGTSTSLLKERLLPQPLWPFAYPYGSKPSFNASVIREVKAVGYDCAFSTFVGANSSGTDAFVLKRVDCIDKSLL